ncbi:MAG: hypothetical protein HQK76_06315 [Desulfobacterales bacterium]|nr:hypothetical protein [Desulfobacterales bacterium]
MESSRNDAQKIIMLLEDDPTQNSNLEFTALRHFGGDLGIDLCVAESTEKLIEEVKHHLNVSPTFKMCAILDYNMNLNAQGEQKPAETLFYNEHFKHYLRNGGIIVIYSAYTEQVRQAKEIIDAQKNYPNLAVLIAEKSTVHLDDIFRFLKGISFDKIHHLRRISETYNFDLGTLIKAIRENKRL